MKVYHSQKSVSIFFLKEEQDFLKKKQKHIALENQIAKQRQ